MILTKLISDKLKLAIDKKGTATFVVSGGTSPLKLFEDLSKIDLPWNKVQITLEDFSKFLAFTEYMILLFCQFGCGASSLVVKN